MNINTQEIWRSRRLGSAPVKDIKKELHLRSVISLLDVDNNTFVDGSRIESKDIETCMKYRDGAGRICAIIDFTDW